MFHKETHLLEQEYIVINKIQQAVRDFSIKKNFTSLSPASA